MPENGKPGSQRFPFPGTFDDSGVRRKVHGLSGSSLKSPSGPGTTSSTSPQIGQSGWTPGSIPPLHRPADYGLIPATIAEDRLPRC